MNSFSTCLREGTYAYVCNVLGVHTVRDSKCESVHACKHAEDPSWFKTTTKRSKTIPLDRPATSLGGFVIFVFIPKSTGQTKVTNLCLVSSCKKDIPSSQVSVNKSLFFQILHSCELNSDLDSHLALI
jgi:hypothetical protein